MTTTTSAPGTDRHEPADTHDDHAHAGMFRSLRVRNYRLYASGQLVSLTGTWMQRVAQDWLVLELTNSGTALGVVTALQFGPSLLLGMYGGVLADRGDKRKMLLVTQSAIALVALVLGLLDVTGVVTYWHVLVLAGALGLIGAIDTPIRQSFVIEMVGKDELTNAVAINSTIFNGGRILGPALAGVLITAAGTGWAFLINAASSVAVLGALVAMRPAELFPSKPVARARGQLREGLRYVRAAARSDADHGADLHPRHLRPELPDHHRVDRQERVPPRRRRLRIAVHRTRRRRAAAAPCSRRGARPGPRRRSCC